MRKKNRNSGAVRKLEKTVTPTGVERVLKENDIIVSKTDTKGKITYGNELFVEISGFTEEELLGSPHSILRHPDMPRCIFKMLWDQIRDGNEVFAYVVNLCRNGDHYWVFAHVTPSYDNDMQIIGYHSMRRMPRPDALRSIRALYSDLLKIEEEQSDRKRGLEASTETLNKLLLEKKVSYDEFVFSL